jgi:hypothetical protein
MYKTVTLPIGEEFEFDDRSLYAKIIPMAYWPNGVQRVLAINMPAEVVEAADANNMQAMFKQVDAIIETFPYLVVDWNLVDMIDRPLPLPRTVAEMDDDGNFHLTDEGRKAYKQIPLPVIFYMFNKAQEDTGDIPPVKPNESPSLQVVRSAEEDRMQRDSLVKRGVLTQTPDGRTLLNVEVPEDQIDQALNQVTDEILTGALQPQKTIVDTSTPTTQMHFPVG